MRILSVIIWLLAVTGLVFINTANADPISFQTYIDGRTYLNSPAEAFYYNITIEEDYAGSFGLLASFSQNDVGSKIVLDSGDQFETAVGLFTNGNSDFIMNYRTSDPNSISGSGWGTIESRFLFGGDPPETPVDLFGTTINNITVSLDEFTLDVWPSHIYYGRYAYDIYALATITINDDDPTPISSAPVPEPATILLLGTGLVGLAGASRRKLKF